MNLYFKFCKDFVLLNGIQVESFDGRNYFIIKRVFSLFSDQYYISKASIVLIQSRLAY